VRDRRPLPPGLQLRPKCLGQHGLAHARRCADGGSCGLLDRVDVRNKGLNLSGDAALFAEGGVGNRNDPLSRLCQLVPRSAVHIGRQDMRAEGVR
jgi:hypothetical protein